MIYEPLVQCNDRRIEFLPTISGPLIDRVALVSRHNLHFELMGTCHKLLDEVRDFFHSYNSLEVMAERQKRMCLDHLPLGGEYVWLHASLIRRLRVSTLVGRSFRLSAVLQWDQLRLLVNLEKLQVDMFTVERQNVHHAVLPTSIALNGIVKSIVERVPPGVELMWGPWEGLRRDRGADHANALTSREGQRFHVCDIPAQVLRDIAVDYELIRGQKLKTAPA